MMRVHGFTAAASGIAPPPRAKAADGETPRGVLPPAAGAPPVPSASPAPGVLAVPDDHAAFPYDDPPLTDAQIDDARHWVRGFSHITVGFDTNAPGSGHMAASARVLERLLELVPASDLSTWVLGEREPSAAQLGRDRGVAGKDDAARRRGPSLLLFGALDQAQARMTALRAGYTVAGVVQPPYFRHAGASAYLFCGPRCIDLYAGDAAPNDAPRLTPRHIYVGDRPPAATGAPPSPAMALIQRATAGLERFLIVYDGGTGEGVRHWETIVRAIAAQLPDAAAPRVGGVLISNQHYDRMRAERPNVAALEQTEPGAQGAGERSTAAFVLTGPRHETPGQVWVLSRALPRTEFLQLVERCDLPSFVCGSNSANDFITRGKPVLHGAAAPYLNECTDGPYARRVALDARGIVETYGRAMHDDADLKAFHERLRGKYGDVRMDRVMVFLACGARMLPQGTQGRAPASDPPRPASMAAGTGRRLFRLGTNGAFTERAGGR